MKNVSPALLLIVGIIFVAYMMRNKNNFTPEAAAAQSTALKNVFNYYRPHIVNNSIRYGIPQPVIAAVIFQESGGNADAEGSHGEIGLMQVTPAALSDVNKKFSLAFSAKDLYFADRNIQTGTAYLSILRNQFAGDIPTALRAYNAGAGNVAASDSAGREYSNSVLAYSSLLT